MKLFLLTAAAGAACAVSASASTPAFANMNGEYLLSPTAGQSNPSFPTNFTDYPGYLPIEYFEVYHGPITSVYSEVYWAPMTNDLPADIVQRFAGGKVMAIVGQEMDQVMRVNDSKTGELVDVSLPISFAYNHHHDSTIVGAGATLREVDRAQLKTMYPDGRINYMRVSHDKVWVAEEHTKPKTAGAGSSWT